MNVKLVEDDASEYALGVPYIEYLLKQVLYKESKLGLRSKEKHNNLK